MSGLSASAYKIFLIERFLDTYSGTSFNHAESIIRKIISGELTFEEQVITTTIEKENP